MEMVAESKILMVHQVCDRCGKGKMQFDPSKLGKMQFDPSKLELFQKDYPHKCNKCGYTENYPVRYPYQKIVPIEVLREPVGKEISG